MNMIYPNSSQQKTKSFILNNQTEMYANYLIDVGKLVFIVGDTQSTTQFRNLFQSSGNPKEKIFYKCIEQLPSDTYKKEKNLDEKKGIIRKDWFTKILNKNPQMIVMTFNCTPQLAENEVWQDRLKIMIKKINKVYDAMRSNNKEEVRLKIIVLISKHTFGGVNLHQKITNFLKNYEKQLNIIQIEYYGKEMAKIRSQWVYGLDKNYENKYKKIQKRWEESFGEKKLGCMVKMAILSEMLSKKQQKNKYLQTYTYLKKRFDESIRTVSILSHSQLRQVRAVSDVIFLRFLKSLISMNTSAELLFKQTQQHMNYFKLKNLGMGQTNKYFYYEELLWRCTFIENFLEILYKNDLMETVSTLSLCELLNELIAYLHALSVVGWGVVNEEKMMGAKVKEERQENYIGLVSYRGEQVLATDIVYTFISDIISHKKDYLSKGIQLITRYKTMNIFKTNQLLFLNIYLLRLYFQDNKFQSFLSTYDQIMKQQLSRSNYFLLNQIFNEIQDEFSSIGEEHKVMFHGMSCLICDYFENLSQLQSRLQHLLFSLKKHQDEENIHNQQPEGMMMESFSSIQEFQVQKSSQLNEQYKFSLKKKSNIASVACFIKNQFVYIEDEYKIKFDIKLNPVIVQSGCKIRIIFNNKTVNSEINVAGGSPTSIQKTLTINPLQHFSRDQTVKIESIVITIASASNLTFTIPNNHINFLKFRQNQIYTKIKCPEVEIKNPYQVYYINEISKFEVNVETLKEFAMDAKCSIKEEDAYGKTQVFAHIQDKINLTNSNYYQELVTKGKTVSQFWLKCNKIGEKTLKFTFHFTIEKTIVKQSHDLLFDSPQTSQNPSQNLSEPKKYVLRQSFNVTKQLKFTIQELFTFKKTFHQFSNDDSRLLENKNIPVGKNITCIIQITAAQNVYIKQIGQHKNPKRIRYIKDIQKRDLHINKGNKLKLNMVFFLTPECKDEIELFLMSNYIKWSRLSSAFPPEQNPYENLFLDNETKINCYTNPLSIFINTKQNFLFKKNQCNKISFKIKNHSDFKNHILVVVEGNPTILRVGEKGKQVFVEPGKESVVDFDILPIASGFLPLPSVKVFVDGVERTMNVKQGQVIKCM